MHVTKTGIVRMNGNGNNGNGQKFSRGESFSAAALMNRGTDHAFDAPGGIAFRLNPDGYNGSKNSAERERVASFVNNWIERTKDPASDIPGAPPLFGQDVVPQAMTFASKIGSQAKTYLPSDEALEANPNDALLMRKDLGIMECLEIRQRMSALLDWSIVPEDNKSPAQKSVAAELTKVVKRVRRFTEYKRCLMDAIWIGRSAIQHTYGHGNIGGKMYCYPRAKHADATGWKHIHGDKIVFRYDDGEKLANGAFPDQMGIRVSSVIQKDARIRGIQDLEYTNSGAAIFLSPAERQTIICHKHMIEDAEYQNPRKAGRIHGVGIRDRIYNEWFLKQEMLGFLMEYMERSAGGIEIYEYPSGDEAAKRSIMEAAKNRMAFGRNQIFFPKPLGMDAGVYDIRIVEPGFAGMDMLVNILDKYFGHRIKRYIIGQTLSTEADATGLGSSVADFQKDSLAQIVMYDSSNLEETLTHELVRPIHLANWPETESWQFELKLELESDNVKEKLDSYRTAWEMGLGIPEKDVAEAIGVSLDNPNEKMLKNAQAGAAPGMANGMQFPPGTGFGNQIDAAHEHVRAAGEVKAAKQGVIDHVAGKVNEGQESGETDQYQREFIESDHPRDNSGRFTESSKTGDSISVPELGRRSAFDAHIVDSDDPENAIVSSLDKEGKPYWKTSVPKKSLHQFHSDLTGDFSYLQKFGSSGNESIDAVISGKAKMIGKGDDSVVFETPDGKVVKASTTVPYHPVGGPAHLTPDAALNQAKVKFGMLQEMKQAGISGIPDTVGIEHGDKFFTVQEKMQIGTPMNREQLQQVKDSVESMHKAGYEIQDELQVGIGPDGKARHYDLGKAGPASFDMRRRDEMNEVASLWKKNGQTWHLPVDEAAQKTEVAQRMAMRDISGGRPVRQQAKEMLKASIDSFNHHGDWDKAFDLHNWLLDNNIMDVYSRQLSLWDEEEHPRDEAGKFAEKGDSRASSSPAETLPEPKKNTGPAGLTKSEAIQKAKKGGTGLLKHAEAVSATMIYLGTNSGQWSAVPVEDMVEVQDASGKGRVVPQFAMPKDYTPVETPWSASGAGGEFCCELCATPIKNAFHIQNDEKKWLMTVGSECVTKFGDGMSGEQLAKKDMQKKRRNLVKTSHEAIRGFAEKIKEEKGGRNLTLQDVARAIGNDDSRKRFWKVAKSLGIDPYSTQWKIEKDGVVHDDDFKHLDGFATREKSTDQKISNWHKKNSEDAEMMLKDLKRFGVDVEKYAREFSESDHPRDNYGKFTSSSSSAESPESSDNDESSTNSLPDYKNAQPRLISETKTPMGKVSIVSGSYKKEQELAPGEFRAETFAQVWRGHEMLEEFSSSDPDEALENAQDLYNDTIEHARRKGETVDSGEESGGISWNVHHDGKGMMEIYLFGPDGNVMHKEGGFDADEESEAVEAAKRIAQEMAEEISADDDDESDDPEKYQRRSHRLLSEAASSTHTSPTPAQREAGNYSKGIFPWKGLEIAIENPKGSTRSGVSPSTGREWSRTMASHYGYFRRTKANDGDNLDVFIGPHPDSEFVLVIKQVDQDGDFDEFKVVVGCLNRKEAKRLYLANYPNGWKCGPAASMTVELFKKWVEKGGPMKARSIKAEC